MGTKRTFHRNLDSAVGGVNLRGELAEWNSADRSSDRARRRRNIAVKSSDTRLLSRREFNERCVALGSLVTLSGALALDAATAVAATGAARTVKFRDGMVVPAIGQGSWHIGQGRHPAADEEEALRTGLSLGTRLIDTSGNYGEGRSEELIKRVIAGQRDRAFVVSKVEADEVTGDAMARACEASLTRLGTDHLDLYLLHSPTANAELSEVVAGFESLRAAGKIRAWGVSNFTVTQMEDLFQIPQGDRCATNQVRSEERRVGKE